MQNCLEFGNYFTTNFERTPTPKFHILTYHAAQFMARWFSIGMFAEQGCESLHGSFNHKRRKYACLKNGWLLAILQQNLRPHTDPNAKDNIGDRSPFLLGFFFFVPLLNSEKS